ncbi:MAG: hypothetical protein QW227_03105 [Candidatus Aenigmatarchaeota archaeon]
MIGMRAFLVSIIVLLVLATTAFGIAVYPQSASAGSYMVNITAGSMGSSVASTYGSEGVIYETIGELGSTNYRVCLGWYCAVGAIVTPYSIHVAGTLTYSNGTIVSDTPITLTIYNSTLNLQYSTDSNTDSSGRFNITLSNLPTRLVDAGFAIRITAYGAVEAVLDKPCVKDIINNKIIC